MKKLFGLLTFILIGSFNFGNCLTVLNTDFDRGYEFYTASNFYGQRDILQYYGLSDNDGFGCIFVNNINLCTLNDGTNIYNMGKNIAYCTDSNTVILNCTSNAQYYYVTFLSESLIKTFFPDYTSLECQTEYNLIPISSVDQNYCVNNGLCPSSECPEIPGSGNWSALYINDIQHLGKPIINITFPDYLDWDYTTTDEEFNLDIVGYPVDTEYIDGVIRTQNYKPTSEDFTQLVGMLAPYSKYLLFLLFIFIIWAWIKKPFKSKKL